MICFLQELKRRKAIRVGSAYVAVGWGPIQIITEFGGALSLPEWFSRAFIVPVLAVLPFVDMSDTRDQSYFSDGLSEELKFACWRMKTGLQSRAKLDLKPLSMEILPRLSEIDHHQS